MTETLDMHATLQRIHALLLSHPGESAAWLASVIGLCATDETRCYRELNSGRMWGGAGSLASEALADNPGLDDWHWQTEIHEFRELMIELGHHLQARGGASPDIDSWLLAFSNWNQSGV
jgi:hypothetical protein